MPAWSASDAFYNKMPLQSAQLAFGKPLKSISDSLAALSMHIEGGGAWCPNIFENGIRGKKSFVSSEFMALDLDHSPSIEVLIADPFISAHACIIYPTASSTPEHPRHRIVIHLSEPVDQPQRWEALQKGLMTELAHLDPDPACKDAARMFFGSDLPGHYFNEQAVLPLEIAGALTQPQALEEDQRQSKLEYKRRKHQYRQSGSKEVSEELVEAIENKLAIRDAYNNSGFTVQAIACPMHSHEHDAERPAAHWNHDKKILHCHKCGRSYLAHEVAEALGFNISDFYSKTVSSIMKCSHEYITQFDLLKLIREDNRTFLIKSPTGTGKTELMKKIILSNPDARVLIITHRRSLVEDMCKRFNKDSNVCFQSYDKLSTAEIRSASRLCICINSLDKLFSFGQVPLHYDFVIMDEIEQQFTHLIGDTFRGHQAVNTYQLLCCLVQDSDIVIGLDAYATLLSFEWFKSLRGDKGAKWIINQFAHSKQNLAVLNTPQDMIAEANHQLINNLISGPIVFAVTSLRMSKFLYSYYSGKAFSPTSDESEIDEAVEDSLLKLLETSPFQFGQDQVVLICGDTMDMHETHDFLNNLNERLPKIKVLIYTSALGTGVDIQIPVKGVFGIFKAGILTADELHQMLARCRNPHNVWVNIKAGGGGRETTAHKLYDRELQNMMTTGNILRTITPEQPVSLNSVVEAYLRFQSRVQSKINRSHNLLRREFLKLAVHKYNIHPQIDDYDDDLLLKISNDMTLIRRANASIDKTMTLRSKSIDVETYQHLQHTHMLTPDTIAGHFRWVIEQVYRQDITVGIYEHAIKNGMSHLINFTDFHSYDSELMIQDSYESLAEFAPHQRNHATARKRLTLKVLKAVWGDFTLLEELSPVHPEDIQTQIKVLPASFSTQAKNVFRWHHNVVTEPINLVRRVLRELGIEFKKIRSGKLKGYYQIDEQTLADMRRYSDHRMKVAKGAEQTAVVMQKSA